MKNSMLMFPPNSAVKKAPELEGSRGGGGGVGGGGGGGGGPSVRPSRAETTWRLGPLEQHQ